MSTFITGATGFIGSHVLARLIEDGETVHVLSRHVPIDPDHPIGPLVDSRSMKIFQGDVLDRSSVRRAMMGCDYVYHMAAFAQNWARDPGIFSVVNVGGAVNVLHARKRNDQRSGEPGEYSENVTSQTCNPRYER